MALEVCLIETALFDWCIPTFAFYGVILMIIGLAIAILSAIFLPNRTFITTGTGIFIIGLVVAVGLSLAENLWNTSLLFKYSVQVGVLIALASLILFGGKK